MCAKLVQKIIGQGAARAVSDAVSMGFDDHAVLRNCGQDCSDVTLAHRSSQSSHGGSLRSVA
jgi:hypothetical protein